MGLRNDIRKKIGVVTVQIEGFFTERFINLCRINNVKIWDVRNIVKGVIRFKICIAEFKKLRSIARKTKCKVIVKGKKGLYFTFFKYRKRKFAALLLLGAILASIVFSTYIWKIEINGNENLSKESIVSALKESGLYVGKSKLGIDTKEIVNNLRVRMGEVSWVGVEINGTNAKIEVVEKTKVAKENVQNNNILGNIIAGKSGVITKIVPENGTAVLKKGNYIEKGTVAIDGTIYSKYIDPIKVIAKGILRADCEYIFEREYSYDEVIKNYNNKKRDTIGFNINSKEFMLNYLNKSKKYDITKHEKGIHLFGGYFSLNFYECNEYEESIIRRTKEELQIRAKVDADTYLQNEILPHTVEGSLTEEEVEILDVENGIKVVTRFTVNEEIGQFIQSEGV